MKTIAHFFHSINIFFGKLASWFTLLLVLIIVIDVCFRYFFNTSYIWVIELEKYFFAIIFLLGSGFAFQTENHVRVDVFYNQWSKRRKTKVNVLGHIFLLIPWCLLVIVVGFNYFQFSFKINESSAQAGGLPALYCLKSLIFIGFGLLLLQAIALLIDGFFVLFSSPKKDH